MSSDLRLASGPASSPGWALDRRITLIVLFAIIRRINQGGYWVLKVQKTARGTYLQPHLANSYQLCSLVFLLGESKL